MKMKCISAVLLAALFLAPFLNAYAEEPCDFRLDEKLVLNGMDRSWLQGYEPTVSYGTLTIILPVLSDQADGEVQAELVMEDLGVSPFKPQDMSVTVQRGRDGVYPVVLKLALFPDRKNGDYPCRIRIAGKDKSGEPLQTDLPYTLHIRDGMPNDEAVRMLITDVQSDLRVGENGVISAKLTNPSKTMTFEQIELRLGDSSGEIIPQYADVLYLPDLQPGESTDVTFLMTVLNKAAVTPHSIRFDLTFQALEQDVSQTQRYTVPVKQEICLEHGGLKMASSVVAGDSVTITLPLMNMGKADVVNTLATVFLPGVAERQSVLVGTIAPGDTKNAQITLTPGKDLRGDFSGTITVETTDNDGNPASFSLPVYLTVEEPVMKEITNDQPVREKIKSSVLTYALAGGCGLLLVSLVVQGILLRKKIHLLEEERL